ncbi:Calmodulin-dependent protein kinase cmk2 [Entomophthora muscae]|uniref:Calmodulin-dependent protein kinase cmk2 n=1 Tax=Entomophthora muscae TaxID=34485 RepID=A0ACC2T0E2_9FUNG|nr:Calmodulin-dependent protein kinase cmk2 [Entomophthora muscae]
MLDEDYKFYPRRWSGISEEAKNFISLLLKSDPIERLTAKEALEHPWFSGITASDQNIVENIREGFNAHLIVKRAYEKLRIVNNMRLMTKSTESLQSNSSPEDLSSIVSPESDIRPPVPPKDLLISPNA